MCALYIPPNFLRVSTRLTKNGIRWQVSNLSFLLFFLYTKRSRYFTDSYSWDVIDYFLSVWNLHNKITGFHAIRKEWKDRVGKTNSRRSANQIRTRLMSLLALIILLFLSIVCTIALFLKNVLKVFFCICLPLGRVFCTGILALPIEESARQCVNQSSGSRALFPDASLHCSNSYVIVK